MNTKTLTPRALSVIDQYVHFKIGMAVCSIPYFNNKTVRARAALRARVGKGSPQEIFEEAQAILVKNHVQSDALADESLKKLLVDNDIGIDCSAFAYYVLNAEGEENGTGSMSKHISFPNAGGLVGRMRSALRPIENCDVATLANDENSRTILPKDAEPGDIITLTGQKESGTPDHILVIHQVEYQNFIPTTIHYSDAVAYPEDGIYGTGVRQGTIGIVRPEAAITEGHWIEGGKEGPENRMFARALASKTELRRLKWL